MMKSNYDLTESSNEIEEMDLNEIIPNQYNFTETPFVDVATSPVKTPYVAMRKVLLIGGMVGIGLALTTVGLFARHADLRESALDFVKKLRK